MTDTLPGIDDILGTVGDDTLFGGYDDEVTVEQTAALNASVAHLGLGDWPEVGEVDAHGFIRTTGYMRPLPDDPEPDTETIILDGRLWRIVRRVGGATVVDGATRRLIEVEEV